MSDTLHAVTQLAHDDTLVAVARAVGAAASNVRVVAVHDTVVRFASASLGWWAEFWRIFAQVMVAVLSLLGGALVQWHFKKRDERRAEAEAAPTRR